MMTNRVSSLSRMTHSPFVQFILRNLLRVAAFCFGIIVGAVIGGLAPLGEARQPSSVAPAIVDFDPTQVPLSRTEYCLRAKGAEYAQLLAASRENQTDFLNQGGLIDGGVCWWHSRLQRSALYLTYFNPQKRRPTLEEVNAILRRLEKNESVVEIGGYKNWREFSSDWASTIQDRLEGWQVRDGFIRQAWVRGLRNRAQIRNDARAAAKLRKLVEEIAVQTEVMKRITYVKVQIPGITAHAWLILSAKKNDDGYTLKYLDSNYRGVRTYTYKFGDQTIDDYGGFLPYVEQVSDFEKIEKAASAYCGS